MENEFSIKLKNIRERKFPGQSIRRVGGFLSSVGEFGKHFFTQLNKMEAGSLIPSPNLLIRILDAYKVTEEERKDIYTAYSMTIAQKKMSEFDEINKKPTMDEAVSKLYRKVKNKK